MQSNSLSDTFFNELRSYNPSNFRTLIKADFTCSNPVLHKACSSVITRYFIFIEKHPELSETDARILYFKLRVDLIARYFAEYPMSSLSDLQPFQNELRRFVQMQSEDADGINDTSVSNQRLDTAN